MKTAIKILCFLFFAMDKSCFSLFFARTIFSTLHYASNTCPYTKYSFDSRKHGYGEKRFNAS